MKPSLAIDQHVARITLRRPAMANKLEPGDLAALVEHVQHVNADKSIKVLLLQSEGKYFCSGYDISEVRGSQKRGSSFGEMVDALESCRAVTIAVIQGGVYGGATDMALACDFRVGSTATEMFMPAARLGLHFYESGLVRYVSRLGLDTAKRLFLTGERLSAQEMYAVGFLTALVAPDALETTVEALTNKLVEMAPLPLFGMKKNLNLIARGKHDSKAIEEEVLQTIESTDLTEGAAAWLERRPPVFIGR